MNDRNLDQLLNAWMDLGPTDAPERVAAAARLEARTTRQTAIPVWSPPRRFPLMNTYVKVALSAAAALVAGVLGYSYLLAPGVGGPHLGDPSSRPGPSLTPAVSPSLAPALNGQNPLPSGRYRVDPALPMNVTIEVPAGWSAGGSWVVRGPAGNEAPDGMAVRFYTASNIYTDPLDLAEGRLDPRVGPSVDDLVAALVDHPDWTVTGTDPIRMDGFDGQVVHVSLPASTSEATPFYLFAPGGGGVVYGWDPDQVFDIYILDVGGDRLVIDAFHFSATPESDLAARDAVLRSIRIEPAP